MIKLNSNEESLVKAFGVEEARGVEVLNSLNHLVSEDFNIADEINKAAENFNENEMYFFILSLGILLGERITIQKFENALEQEDYEEDFLDISEDEDVEDDEEDVE